MMLMNISFMPKHKFSVITENLCLGICYNLLEYSIKLVFHSHIDQLSLPYIQLCIF